MSEIIIIDTKNERLEGDVTIAIHAEKITAISVERNPNYSETQKYVIKILGPGLCFSYPIVFSLSNKMSGTDQQNFLMDLQSKLVKKVWGNTVLMTKIVSTKMGL
jgi:hypothetical protein